MTYLKLRAIRGGDRSLEPQSLARVGRDHRRAQATWITTPGRFDMSAQGHPQKCVGCAQRFEPSRDRDPGRFVPCHLASTRGAMRTNRLAHSN